MSESIVPTMTAIMVRKPKEILREAAEVAKALTGWMKNKLKPVIFNGEQYPEFEDWQLCGKFYNLTTRVSWTRPIEFGGVFGFEAGADVIDQTTGQIISSAEAMCLNDEDKWSKRTKYEWMYVCKDGSKQVEDPGSEGIVWEDNPFKPGSKRPKKEKVANGEVSVPLFQLRSMAQTRAQAKALRNVLSWIFVLAGFKPNIAEEMTGDETQDQKESNPKEGAKPAPVKDNPATSKEPPEDEGQKVADDKQMLFEKLRTLCLGDQQKMSMQLKRLTTYSSKKTGKHSDGKTSFDDISPMEAKIALQNLNRELEADDQKVTE